MDFEKIYRKATRNHLINMGLSDLEYDDEKYDDEPQMTVGPQSFYEEEKMLDDQERAKDMNNIWKKIT